MQQTRRTNPYPWSWELPAGACLVAVLTVLMALHAARSVANFVSAGWWSFTNRAELFTSVPGLLRGEPSTGLPGLHPGYADPNTYWATLIVVEVVVLTALTFCGRRMVLRWGPGRVRGMATASEAEQLLGIRRLRKSAPIVRPDLESGGRQ